MLARSSSENALKITGINGGWHPKGDGLRVLRGSRGAHPLNLHKAKFTQQNAEATLPGGQMQPELPRKQRNGKEK